MFYIFITRLNGELKTFVIEEYNEPSAIEQLENRYIPAKRDEFWIIESYEMDSEPRKL